MERVGATIIIKARACSSYKALSACPAYSSQACILFSLVAATSVPGKIHKYFSARCVKGEICDEFASW